MNNHFADAIYIVGHTQAHAEEMKSSINLRGFDRVKCYSLDQAAAIITDHPPDLIIIDPEGKYKEAIGLIGNFQHTVPVIFLAETFEEDLFLNCFDAGAKDFLVKPVNSSYLVSRVLLALDSRRLREQLEQRDVVLKDLAVIGKYSNVFTTEHVVKMLKREVERLSGENLPALSLLVVQLEGFDTRLAVDADFKRFLYHHVANILIRCCRGSDIIGEYFEDKFAIILPSTGVDGAETVSTRVIERLDGQPMRYGNEEVRLSLRIGAADFSGCLHYEDLLNKAMENLKQARMENRKVQMA